MLGRQRLIVRRTRLLGAQAELWPDWRHFAFFTNRTDAIELVEAEHRGHAVVELAIRDLKDQALAHFPSGMFTANAAWTVIAALAHNLLRWTTVIGTPDAIIPTARTLRRRLLTVPGRITRTARTVTIRMPARWPWETEFLTALERLRTHQPDRRGRTSPRPRPRPARIPTAQHAATASAAPRHTPDPTPRTNNRSNPHRFPRQAKSATNAATPKPNGGSRLRCTFAIP